MWLSKQIVNKYAEQESAALGTVCTAGGSPSVNTDTERRNLQIISPGGYGWVPEDGRQALVLPGTPDMLLGQVGTPPVELEPGEVCLYTGKCAIILRNDGTIELNGRVLINGVEVTSGE